MNEEKEKTGVFPVFLIIYILDTSYHAMKIKFHDPPSYEVECTSNSRFDPVLLESLFYLNLESLDCED